MDPSRCGGPEDSADSTGINVSSGFSDARSQRRGKLKLQSHSFPFQSKLLRNFNVCPFVEDCLVCVERFVFAL